MEGGGEKTNLSAHESVAQPLSVGLWKMPCCHDSDMHAEDGGGVVADVEVVCVELLAN